MGLVAGIEKPHLVPCGKRRGFRGKVDDGVGSQGDMDARGQKPAVGMRSEVPGCPKVFARTRAVDDVRTQSGQPAEVGIVEVVDMRKGEGRDRARGIGQGVEKVLDGAAALPELKEKGVVPCSNAFQEGSLGTGGMCNELAFIEGFSEVGGEREAEIPRKPHRFAVGMGGDGVDSVGLKAKADAGVRRGGGLAAHEGFDGVKVALLGQTDGKELDVTCSPEGRSAQGVQGGGTRASPRRAGDVPHRYDASGEGAGDAPRDGGRDILRLNGAADSNRVDEGSEAAFGMEGERADVGQIEVDVGVHQPGKEKGVGASDAPGGGSGRVKVDASGSADAEHGRGGVEGGRWGEGLYLVEFEQKAAGSPCRVGVGQGGGVVSNDR